MIQLVVVMRRQNSQPLTVESMINLSAVSLFPIPDYFVIVGAYSDDDEGRDSGSAYI